ncbi:MAG TPA: HlyD family efflux transporter periplasmic adaptor subunit [Spongiibacteraceae bacterium]|nr:HlyD family efflux transporter periplasmic adaptor subunit [Spongiibacteraceae bacterium]
MNNSEQNNAATAPHGRRRKQMSIAASIFAAIGIAYGAYWLLDGRFYEDTDDAYVAGNIVQVTPQVAGTVVAIKADDTDFVRAGDALVQLDKADAKVALDQAEAVLAQTVRQVRSLFTTNASLSANVELAKTQLAKAQSDLERRKNLAKTGAVSSEELHHVEAAVKSAQADLLAAQERLTTNQALTENTDIEHHPAVLQAAAKVHEAYLALQRASIPASVSGYIAKRSVQIGQRVAPGNPLMAIVPLDQVWVDANFKEGQIAHLRIGQPVTLEADVYGSKVEYRGNIVGLSAGTGSAFSLLPAQNATGNWIKVVQRIPVKISLDKEQVRTHPLRIGLSVVATVDIKDQSGPQLSDVTRTAPAYRTDVYGKLDVEADALVKRIIDGNRGIERKKTRAQKQQAAQRQKSAKELTMLSQIL